jgi:hypothetical protein
MHVDLAAVAVAAILRTALVAVRWSPPMFLSRWMHLAGITRDGMQRGWLGASCSRPRRVRNR